MKNLNILITGYNSTIGKEIIKTIQTTYTKKLNIKIFSSDYIQPIYSYIEIEKLILFPDFFKKKNVSEKDWIRSVIKNLNKYKIDFVFIGIDFELEIFSKNKAYIESKTKTKIIISDYQNIKYATDKSILQLKLKEFGFNYIKEYQSKNIKRFNFPIIIKPKKGTSSVGIKIIKNDTDLKLLNLDNNSFAQEFIPGEEFTAGVTRYKKHIYLIPLKRQLKKGDTIYSKFEMSYLKDLSSKLVNIYTKFNFYGPVNFQFKIFKKKIYIFEINPRFSGTTFIRSMFGYNEFKIFINEMIYGKKVKVILKEGEVIRFYSQKFLVRSSK